MKFSIEITTSTNISDLPNPEIVKDIYIVFVPDGNYHDILNTVKKLIEKDLQKRLPKITYALLFQKFLQNKI